MENIGEKIKRAVEMQTTPEALAEGHRIWLECEKNNPNNFSYWHNKIMNMRVGPTHEMLHVPVSYIFQLPDELLGAFLLEEKDDKEKLMKWINSEVYPFVKEKFPNGCFLKNGCFSNKFKFNSSCRLTEITPESIFEHMFNIEEWAFTLETYGNLEFVFRQWIEPARKTDTIYSGMPLRPEIRTFFDFDKKKSIYSVNYWDWDYCSRSMTGHDLSVFEFNRNMLEKKFEENRKRVEDALDYAMEWVDLKGIWSIDTMLEGPHDEHFYLIDMAVGNRSAYWDVDKIKEYLNKQ